jgi:hypothetical protein
MEMTVDERLRIIENHIRALEREVECMQSSGQGSYFNPEPWPIEEPPKDRPFEANLGGSRGWTKLCWDKWRLVWDALDSRGHASRDDFTEWREIR